MNCRLTMSAIGGKADIPRNSSSSSNGAKLHKSSGVYKSVEGVLCLWPKLDLTPTP